MSNGNAPFDLAVYQRDRIRDLERDNAGLRLLLEHAVWQLAETIYRLHVRAQVEAMTQDEFMQALQLESDRFTSRPEGSFPGGCQPLGKSLRPSFRSGKIGVG